MGITSLKSAPTPLSLALLLALFLAGSIAAPARSCIDPNSQFAVEVVLNKQGVSYNPQAFAELVNEGLVLAVDDATYVLKYTLRYSIVYESSARELLKQIDFVVVVYNAMFSGETPCLSLESCPGEVNYYPAVRVELLVQKPVPTPTQTPETPQPYPPPTPQPYPPPGELETSQPSGELENTTTYVYVEPGDFKLALREVLRALVTEIGSISGLTAEDIERIVAVAEPGKAGWNSRLIYSSKLGDWRPFDELVVEGYVNGVLLRGNACSTPLNTDVLGRLMSLPPALTSNIDVPIPTPPPGPPPVPPGPETTPQQTPPLIPRDLASTAISVVAGLAAALIVYLVVKKYR